MHLLFSLKSLWDSGFLVIVQLLEFKTIKILELSEYGLSANAQNSRRFLVILEMDYDHDPA